MAGGRGDGERRLSVHTAVLQLLPSHIPTCDLLTRLPSPPGGDAPEEAREEDEESQMTSEAEVGPWGWALGPAKSQFPLEGSHFKTWALCWEPPTRSLQAGQDIGGCTGHPVLVAPGVGWPWFSTCSPNNCWISRLTALQQIGWLVHLVHLTQGSAPSGQGPQLE